MRAAVCRAGRKEKEKDSDLSIQSTIICRSGERSDLDDISLSDKLSVTT